MHQHLINASLQVVPIIQNKHPYKWIDEVIEIIKKSGLTYDLGAFATVVEGKYDEVMKLVNDVNKLV